MCSVSAISDYYNQHSPFSGVPAASMRHREPKMAGRYVEAFSWHRGIEFFVSEKVTERPLLTVCSGPVSDLGDVRVDRYVAPRPPGVMADWAALPFKHDAFGSVFADPPWNLGQMKTCADFCREALRVAPVLWLMAPWLWVHRDVRRGPIYVREFPGVNVPILIVRYERRNSAQISFDLE
jgi:hypothetical protein